MSEELKKIHRKFAVECFNNTWTLIEKSDRTAEDDAQMLHLAHASRFHWGEIGTPLNFARGDWQLSRVYSILGHGENALVFAKSSLHLCLEHDFGDFDLAFAYEAAARAFSVLGDSEMLAKHLKLAKNAGNEITKDDDKEYFFNELATIN